MEQIKITLSDEQVYDLELIYRNMNVDCHNYITDGLTFSKVYGMIHT